MADYTSAYTGAQIDAAIADAQTALQPDADITLTGTGRRIKADFSNATEASRAMFQTSTANEGTTITAIPSAATMGSAFVCAADADIDNTSKLKIASDTVSAEIKAAGKGTGAYLPLKLVTDNATAITCTASGTSTAGNAPHVLINSETDDGSGSVLQVAGSESISGNLKFTGTGNRIQGDFANGTQSLRAMFQSSTGNQTTVGLLPPSGQLQAGVNLYNTSDSDTAGRLQIAITGTAAQLISSRTGSTANYLPLRFSADNATAIHITASGTTTAGSNPLVLVGGNTTTTDLVAKLQVNGIIKIAVYTVATLPTGTLGCKSFVSDANSTTFASIVAAGGANFVPVYHDGTNWRIG